MSMTTKADMNRGCGRGRCDEGTGTMLGAMLILMIAILMSMAAIAGAILIASARARGIADIVAVSAARSLWEGAADPCDIAQTVAQLGNAGIGECVISGDDVQVSIRLPTGIPLAASVTQHAKAGPVLCEH